MKPCAFFEESGGQRFQDQARFQGSTSASPRKCVEGGSWRAFCEFSRRGGAQGRRAGRRQHI